MKEVDDYVQLKGNQAIIYLSKLAPNSISLLKNFLESNQEIYGLEIISKLGFFDDIFEMLCDAISNISHIKRLVIGNHMVSAGDAAKLAGLMGSYPDLLYIGFNDCKFLEEGLSEITNGIQANNSIETIMITGSNLGDFDISGLINILKDKSQLTNLFLMGCNIGDLYGKMFIDLLAENKSLRTLNLSGNKLCDQTAVQIAKALPKQITLHFFDLSENIFSRKASIALLRGIRRNRTLEYFSINSESSSFKLNSYFLKAIETNCSLSRMGVGNVSNKTRRKIVKQLGLNKYGPRKWYNETLPLLIFLNKIPCDCNMLGNMPYEIFYNIMLTLKLSLIIEEQGLWSYVKYESESIKPFLPFSSSVGKIQTEEWMSKYNKFNLSV